MEREKTACIRVALTVFGVFWLIILPRGLGEAQETNQVQAKNYVVNGDFEKEGDPLSGWELNDLNEGSYSADSVVKRSGNCSLRMMPNTKPGEKGPQVDGVFIAQQSFVPETGGNLKLEAFVMVSEYYNGQMPRLYLNCYTKSGKGGSSIYVEVIGAKGQWLKLEKAITVPGDIARVYLALWTFGNSGCVWLDEVKVIKGR